VNREARLALAIIYGLVALAATLPQLPLAPSGEYYSLALLNEECELGPYTTTLVAGVEYRYCIYIANNSGEVRVLRVHIRADGSGNMTVDPENITLILVPGQNHTVPVSVLPVTPGNYTITANLYVLNGTRWQPTNVTVNLTVKAVAVP